MLNSSGITVLTAAKTIKFTVPEYIALLHYFKPNLPVPTVFHSAFMHSLPHTSLCKQQQTEWTMTVCTATATCLRVSSLRCSGGSGRPSGQRLCDPWHGEQHGGGDPLPPGGGEHPVRTRFPSRSIHHGPEEGRAGRAKVSRALRIEPACQLTIWPLGLCLRSNVRECHLKSGGRLASRVRARHTLSCEIKPHE